MRNPIIEEDLKNITNFNLPWQKFYGKTVLITGAAGMIPAYLTEVLLYLNESRPGAKIRVVGLVRDRRGAQRRFAVYKKRKDLRLIIGDVSLPFKIPGEVDYIFHAASKGSPKFYGQDPVGILLPNVLGTYRILELAREKAIKSAVFFSSAEVYGQPDLRLRSLKEDDFGYLDPSQVRSCYAESKRLGETMCASWCKQYGVPVKIVRPFHTYGPGMKLDDGRVFSDFVANVVHNRDLVLNSDGQASRAFCYLADAISGFFTVLLKGDNGHAYNVANNHGQTSILNLAKTVAGLFPEKRLKVKINSQPKLFGYLKSPVKKIFPNIDKISALGWRPTISVPEGFNRTINSFIKQNL